MLQVSSHHVSLADGVASLQLAADESVETIIDSIVKTQAIPRQLGNHGGC